MDLNNVKQATDMEFEIIPVGEHELIVEEVNKTYSNSGKPMIVMKIGAKGYSSTILHHVLIEYSDGIFSMFNAKGIDDLEGKKTKGKVIHEDYNDKTYAKIIVPMSPIPANNLIRNMIRIKKGGYDDPSKGWTGGYATKNPSTGSVYLNCEFTVTEGEFKGRKYFSLIGLHSEKGPTYGNIGLSQMRSIIDSANELKEDDDSSQAIAIRKDFDFEMLDGLEFWSISKIGKDNNSQPRNELGKIVTPDSKEWSMISTFGMAKNFEDAPFDIDKEAESKMTNADRLRKKPEWAE